LTNQNLKGGKGNDLNGTKISSSRGKESGKRCVNEPEKNIKGGNRRGVRRKGPNILY